MLLLQKVVMNTEVSALVPQYTTHKPHDSPSIVLSSNLRHKYQQVFPKMTGGQNLEYALIFFLYT